jgi:hypothetical protein
MPYLPEFRTLSHKKMTSCRSIHTVADAECCRTYEGLDRAGTEAERVPG